MAILKSGAGTDECTIDPTSKAIRLSLYGSTGAKAAWGGLNTFSSTNTFTPIATPTDLVVIIGSTLKTIKVLSFVIGTNNTAAGSQQFFLVKRNAPNVGGTFVVGKNMRHDSVGGRATATVGHYTANPTSLGNAIGTVNVVRAASPIVVPTDWGGVIDPSVPTNGVQLLPKINSLVKPITLRGKDELLCLNFNGAALVGGQVHQFRIIWTEE